MVLDPWELDYNLAACFTMKFGYGMFEHENLPFVGYFDLCDTLKMFLKYIRTSSDDGMFWTIEKTWFEVSLDSYFIYEN